MDDTTPADETAADAAPATPVATTEGTSRADEIADELLLEEVSIDGMCGVY